MARDYICEANSETVHTKARGINDLVFHMASGFSLFYGLLLGLLTVAAYQNLEEVRQNVFGQASALASLYRDVSFYPEPYGSELRQLLRDYTLYVIYKDWPDHRDGKIYNGGRPDKSRRRFCRRRRSAGNPSMVLRIPTRVCFASFR